MTSSDTYSEMEIMMRRYLQYLETRNYSKATLRNYHSALKHFRLWMEDRGLSTPQTITRAMLERYQTHLHNIKTTKGKALAVVTQSLHLTSIRLFFSWLAKHNHLLYNPSSELELPRLGDKLPKAILSPEEIETIMQQVDLKKPLGYRDRAILETFYSTGIRRQELCNLEIGHIDVTRGAVMIREGKFNKDRLIPIGERALAWIDKYLSDVRPSLAFDTENKILFLNYKGYAFKPDGLSELVRKYIQDAGIDKPGACHLFRHSMATAMLDNGADIRYIQDMLGHASIETTKIYTRVSITKLKEVHARAHPGANFHPKSHAANL